MEGAAYLRQKASDIQLMLDESIHTTKDAARACRLKAAENFGLTCMVGCMPESKITITAGLSLVASRAKWKSLVIIGGIYGNYFGIGGVAYLVRMIITGGKQAASLLPPASAINARSLRGFTVSVTSFICIRSSFTPILATRPPSVIRFLHQTALTLHFRKRRNKNTLTNFQYLILRFARKPFTK